MPSFTTEESKELNAWLAVNLLGWVHSHASLADCRFTLCWHHPETDYLAMYAPKSATSYEGMGAVIRQMRERGWRVSISDFEDGPYSAEFYSIARVGIAEELELPLAVALAARDALGAGS